MIEIPVHEAAVITDGGDEMRAVAGRVELEATVSSMPLARMLQCVGWLRSTAVRSKVPSLHSRW